MEQPAARNYLASSAFLMDSNWSSIEYCPQCLNMGNPMVVSGAGKYTWPAGNNSGNTVCGDSPKGTPQYLLGKAGGPFRRYNYLWYRNRTFGQAYVKGASFPLSIYFTTYHRGAIQMQLCVIPDWTIEREQKMLTNECFEQRILKQASNGTQPGEEWWYLPKKNGNGSETYNLGWSGYMSTYFQLPEDVGCNFFNDNTKCVLRMYYLTGNTCNVPNVPAAYSKNTTASLLPTCGTVQAAYPEEFRYGVDVCVGKCVVLVQQTGPPYIVQQLCRYPRGQLHVVCSSKESSQHRQCVSVWA